MKWIGAVLAAIVTAACVAVGYHDAQVAWQKQVSAQATLMVSEHEALITGVLPAPQGFEACELSASPPCVALNDVAAAVDAAEAPATADVAIGVLLSTPLRPEPSTYVDAIAGAPSAVHARYGAAAHPPVTRGVVPAAPDELAVSALVAEQAGIGLGDVVTLTTATGATADFTVVGLLPGATSARGFSLWGAAIEVEGWPYVTTLEGLSRLQGSGGAPVVVTYAWDGDPSALGSAVPSELAHEGFEGVGSPAEPWTLVALAAVAAMGLWFVAVRSLRRRSTPASAPWAATVLGIFGGAALGYGATWLIAERLRSAHAELAVAPTIVPPWSWLALGVATSAAVVGLVVVVASGLERPARVSSEPDS